jgi:hypothetical protein
MLTVLTEPWNSRCVRTVAISVRHSIFFKMQLTSRYGNKHPHMQASHIPHHPWSRKTAPYSHILLHVHDDPVWRAQQLLRDDRPNGMGGWRKERALLILCGRVMLLCSSRAADSILATGWSNDRSLWHSIRLLLHCSKAYLMESSIPILAPRFGASSPFTSRSHAAARWMRVLLLQLPTVIFFPTVHPLLLLPVWIQRAAPWVVPWNQGKLKSHYQR